MTRQHRRDSRTGSVLPILFIAIIVLMAMIALAVDIGLLASARAQAQSVADLAALAGTRQLNGDTSDTSNLNNVSTALSTAQNRADDNTIFHQAVTASMITTKNGIYTYDSTLQRFVASYPSTPGTNAWSVIQVNLNTTMPTYFGRVFGMNSFNVKAVATAAHRPRDIALILDYSGSMRFGCQSAYPSTGNYTGSLNPDTIYPQFGHYSTIGSSMQKTTDYVDSGGETHATNNLTITTTGGNPIVQDFLTRDSSNNLVNAFNKPQPDATYSATQTPTAMPAPNNFKDQSSSPATYVGDKWPLKNKLATGSNWAATLQELLTGANTGVTNATAKNTTYWEVYTNNGGYDAVFGQDKFKGFSMGPAYYGKTFWIWPPDPRWGDSTGSGTPDPTNLSTTNPVKDSNGLYIADWRKRFFVYGESYGTTALRGKPLDDNSILFNSSGYMQQPSSTGYRVNYAAILKWLTTGPQVLPSNLRAGRILYYSAIPTTIPLTGGTLDQVFWREYINTVLGVNSSQLGKRSLVGVETSAWGTLRITANSSMTASPKPYMRYDDNPMRPRAHMWFGPYTMMMFITADNDTHDNMWAGTVHESQSWVLKAGINSALDDIRKNHPNDWASEIFFSDINSFATPRCTLGRDYTTMKNALFFPFSLLSTLTSDTAEIRPYDTSFNYTGAGDIPNANGGTTPEMAFKVAYNQFSGATGFNGRHGATKVCIFETDGVPNTTGNGTFVNGGAYKSYYNSISAGSYLGNNNSTVVTQAVSAVTQLCALDTASNPGYSSSRNPARVHAIAFGNLFESGSSLRGTALDFLAQIQVAGNTSPTGTDGAGYEAAEPYKLITGDSSTRVDKIRQAMERIMQSGVQVSLIQ